MNNNHLIIWRFVDGKPGHEKQSQALVEGIQRWLPATEYQITPASFGQINRAILTKTWPSLAIHPKPDLLIGAGHKTHWSLLAAKRVFGGRSVLLMNPSLPASWFDIVITPAHDGYKESGRRVVSPTALAPTLVNDTNANRGLILVGGVSSHFLWDEDFLCHKIESISQKFQCTEWAVSNSRRTPKKTTEKLLTLCQSRVNLSFYDVESLDSSWLPQQLGQAERVWITSDSASMVAEALNSKAATGVIILPTNQRSKANKLLVSIKGLIDSGEIGFISANEILQAPSRAAPANYHYQVAYKTLERLGIKLPPKAS